jgi:RNA binding exosome subunit
MAASKKAIENANRLRYIRALERFHKSIIAYLSNNSEADKERYDKKIDNALKLYNRVEETPLYKGELQELQKLVKKMIAYKQSSEDIKIIQEDLLYSSNQLEKSKNARRYKKEKHSKSKFDEWE